MQRYGHKASWNALECMGTGCHASSTMSIRCLSLTSEVVESTLQPSHSLAMELNRKTKSPMHEAYLNLQRWLAGVDSHNRHLQRLHKHELSERSEVSLEP